MNIEFLYLKAREHTLLSKQIDHLQKLITDRITKQVSTDTTKTHQKGNLGGKKGRDADFLFSLKSLDMLSKQMMSQKTEIYIT